MSISDQPRVGLFVTCLVNLFRPSVGFASIKLLEDAGCIVDIPNSQTCCGQPGYNPGDFDSTRAVAKQVIDTFLDYDYVVVPSGSCAGMLRLHYPALFKNDKVYLERAEKLSAITYELTSFLVDILKYQAKPNQDRSTETITYHDACAGLRELGIKTQPRKLLQQAANVTVAEMNKTEECCGFGGTFCAKMPAISEKMVSDKLSTAIDTGASLLLAGDMGCLLNIAGRARRLNKPIQCRHVAEVLAGELDTPGIGESDQIYTSQTTESVN